MPISLTVEPTGPPVKPKLFVLNPQQPEGVSVDKMADNVCLAADFSPKEGDMVMNVKDGNISTTTSSAALSTTEKTYFFAEFTNETIYSCELNDVSSNNENVDMCADLHPEKAKLNFYLLMMNGVRVVFTKTLAFNTILTIRAVLF